MHILQMSCGQTAGQHGVVELWIVARARNGANVHEAPDAVGLQQADEVLTRQGGVTKSENGALRPFCILWCRMLDHGNYQNAFRPCRLHRNERPTWWGRQFNVNWVADPDFATGQNNAHDTGFADDISVRVALEGRLLQTRPN